MPHDLRGTRICLVRESGVEHGARIPLQVALLQQAGAQVTLLTSDSRYATDVGIFDSATVAALGADDSRPDPREQRAVESGRLSTWSIIQGLKRGVKCMLGIPEVMSVRQSTLRRIATETDLFWVVDYQALPSTMAAARRWGNGRVLYDTLDLLPEYAWEYISAETQELRKEGERLLIGEVAGFVTASESYADYYDEKYSSVPGYRRPIVFGNAPEYVTQAPAHLPERLRFLFLGNLTFDRPIFELLEAVRLVKSDIVLTLQGENRLGPELFERITELGLEDRVVVLDPVAPPDVVVAAAAHDVGIVMLRGDNENERRAETSKAYTYSAAGLALLGSDLPGIKRVIETGGHGILVTEGTPSGWARMIDHISFMDRGELINMREAAIKFAEASRPSMQSESFLAEVARAVRR